MTSLSSSLDQDTKKAIVKAVSGWYEWCIANAPNSVNHTTSLKSAEVGHVSNKNMSVKLTTTDGNNIFNVYLNLESWFVKGYISGKEYRFSKKALKSIDSYIQEEN